MQKTAIVLGATGVTGKELVALLLKNPLYKSVIVFTRRPSGIHHKKLKEHQVNLFKLEEESSKFIADEVYCCIGTTAAKTPDKVVYEQIDYGIPYQAAKLAAKNNINTFVVISALGANSNSRIFYNRTKGKMEKAVLQQNIPNTYIVRPSLIAGSRKEKRPGEWFFKQLMKLLNPLMFGPLKKYRAIHPITIAKAMLVLANNEFKSGCYENHTLFELAKTY